MGNPNITPQDVEKRVNLGDVMYTPLQLGSQIVRRSRRVAKGLYDFSVLGGAIGTIKLIDPVWVSSSQPKLLGVQGQPNLVLPPSAIVIRALIDVLTTVVGPGASIAVGTGVATGDLKAAAAIAGYAAGLVECIPVNTAATSIKVPATTAQPGLNPSMTISGAVVTAGKFNVHIEYYLSD
jgi:hypothetical protein